MNNDYIVVCFILGVSSTIVIIFGILTYTFNGYLFKDPKKDTANMMSIKANKEAEKRLELENRARATLRKINFPTDPINILKLLENKDELNKIIKKLNLKVFW